MSKLRDEFGCLWMQASERFRVLKFQRVKNQRQLAVGVSHTVVNTDSVVSIVNALHVFSDCKE